MVDISKDEPHFCTSTNEVTNKCDAQWMMLYSFAAHINENPDDKTKLLVKNFLSTFPDQCITTSCGDCLTSSLRKLPLEFNSRRSLMVWLCSVENQCRRKANLPQRLCRYDELIKRWRYEDGRL